MNNDYIKDILEKDMDRFDSYIEKADNKANYVLAISGALLIAIIFQSKDLLARVSNTMSNKVLLLSIIIATFLIISIILSILTIIPRTPKSTTQSLFYFQDVKEFKNNEFYTHIISKSNNECLNDLSFQVVQLSTICSKKMSKVKYSYISLCLSLIGLIILALVTL